MAKNNNSVPEMMAWLETKLNLIEHVQYMIQSCDMDITTAEESLTEDKDNRWAKENYTKAVAKKKAYEQIAISIADL